MRVMTTTWIGVSINITAADFPPPLLGTNNLSLATDIRRNADGTTKETGSFSTPYKVVVTARG